MTFRDPHGNLVNVFSPNDGATPERPDDQQRGSRTIGSGANRTDPGSRIMRGVNLPGLFARPIQPEHLPASPPIFLCPDRALSDAPIPARPCA
jgi:hypothetical protein